MTAGPGATFEATVRRWSGDAAWYFATLPLDLGDEIRATTEPVGFGSVRVRVTVGATSWSTSVFPDRASGSYVLPVKAAVRAAEGIDDGSQVVVRLEVVPAPVSGSAGRRNPAGH